MEKNSKKKKKQFWLVKTEPREWSWTDQKSNNGISIWDGVKNKQSQNYMKSMNTGDNCFFYHSGTDRKIVGVVEVIRTWYDINGGDGGGAVDVKEVGELSRHVALGEIKEAAANGDEAVKGLKLLKQPRLSVSPVPEEAWVRIRQMGGGIETAALAEEQAPAAAEEEEQRQW